MRRYIICFICFVMIGIRLHSQNVNVLDSFIYKTFIPSLSDKNYSDTMKYITEVHYKNDIKDCIYVVKDRRTRNHILICSYKDGKLNGPHMEYWSNGKIENELSYINGKLNGLCKYYNIKGKLLYQNFYVDGQLNGPWISFNGKTGKITGIFYCKNHKCGDRYLYDSKGRIYKIIKIDENGKIEGTIYPTKSN